jgi:hypothetical protein
LSCEKVNSAPRGRKTCPCSRGDMMVTFMAAVESTVVTTSMPAIVGDPGDFHLFSWVFAAYLLTQATSVVSLVGLRPRQKFARRPCIEADELDEPFERYSVPDVGASLSRQAQSQRLTNLITRAMMAAGCTQVRAGSRLVQSRLRFIQALRRRFEPSLRGPSSLNCFRMS